MNQQPFTTNGNDSSQQIALLSQRVEILISTVEQEFRGFRDDSNRIMTRQETIERKSITEESRLTSGLKRLDDFYLSYGIDRKQQIEGAADLKEKITQMEIKMAKVSNDVSLMVKIMSILGTTIGGWMVAQILGLIK